VSTGKFITIEGGEGAGKSTQLRLLADWLYQRGIAVTTTREPGGSQGAEAIRKLLVEGATDRWDATTEALLHFAARRDHLVKTVWPALKRGEWVVSDRFGDSTMAYQGYGHGLGRDAIERLYDVTVGDFRPDLTLILDIPVDAGLQRALARSGSETRYERMDIEFHRKLRQGFLDIAAREPQRCRVIDAKGTVDQVQAQLRAAVAQALTVAE
jgi:dTMP kinase